MRILLVMPAPFERGRLGLENVVWLSEPVALTSVAGAVSQDHAVQILDMRLEPEEALAKAINQFKPDVVGTTSMTTDAYQAKAILRTAREMIPSALTVIGGHHPTLSPHEFDQDYVDVIVQGEGERTFQELVAAWETKRNTNQRSFPKIAGIRYRDGNKRVSTSKRNQQVDLDTLPKPDRTLIRKYYGRYFYTFIKPMASIFTSRGCSFDCNFCAIWEFYERRTRYLSAKTIVDRMLECEEDFIFLLDDNFLTNRNRLIDLCDELESRKAKKYWMTQGRTDFVANNPELIARLAKNGMVGLLSGFESNDDDNLAALRKKNTWDNNVRANQILKENGVFTTGIFMARPDWTAEQFDSLYDYINSLHIGIPLVTILTPLPGTQLYRTYKDKLLTTDHRLFDLLHPVLPTRLPREEFYRHFSQSLRRTKKSYQKAALAFFRKRWRFLLKYPANLAWFYARTLRYQRIHGKYQTFLADEKGLLNGPGRNLDHKEVHYPESKPELSNAPRNGHWSLERQVTDYRQR